MMERKLRQPAPGQPKPALTQLKELDAEERSAVMDILRTNTYGHARELVAERVGFRCSKGALCRFFSWQAKQQAAQESQDILGQVERFMRQQHPEWTEEKLREMGNMFFVVQSMKDRDTKGFISLTRLGILDQHRQLESQKLDLYLKKFEQETTAPSEPMKGAT
ncbi:MAG TPA: hypothetical protein VGI88_01385 [Verrucomicrobiae bacterium]|jgi:hypothetical protein